jgi:hypothetical protein
MTAACRPDGVSNMHRKLPEFDYALHVSAIVFAIASMQSLPLDVLNHQLASPAVLVLYMIAFYIGTTVDAPLYIAPKLQASHVTNTATMLCHHGCI